MRMNRERIGGQFCSVYLDGVKQLHCFEADDAEGWALCGVTDERGTPIHDPDGYDGAKVETREGRIEFRFDPAGWRQVAEIADVLERISAPGVKRFFVGWERG